MRKKGIILAERAIDLAKEEDLSYGGKGLPVNENVVLGEVLSDQKYDEERIKDPIFDPFDISQGVQEIFKEDCEDQRDCVTATCSCRNTNVLASTASEDEPPKPGNEYNLVGNVLGEPGGEGFGIVGSPRRLR